ncbi:Alpha/beta hydrolase family protein [Bremerella volcania]|uniref:Alpha/beta hydrolase family protein n=1 Tax=Bremerella volcania TaxID=2527984 RepID=A0A518CCN9_9BACT|nr:dienelactone hydrolase family protein [Bremerella volcania]QDU76993.1 Alpha/beta hydrolase family protein [Bremerella volcania]
MGRFLRCVLICVWLFAFVSNSHAETPSVEYGPALPGTRLLEMEGDGAQIASQMVAGIDRFLLQEIAAAPGKRTQYWDRNTSSPEAYARSVEKNRQRLAETLGVRDERQPKIGLQRTTSVNEPQALASSQNVDVIAVDWPVFGVIRGEGLLLRPKGQVHGSIVAIPDAAQTPEQLAGLDPGIAPSSQFARQLAESGFQVVIPTIITRERGLLKFPGPRQSQLPGRELLYRSAFELGRHLIGYEVQKVLAAVDAFAQDGKQPIGVIGYGEGGMLALYAGALDERIDSVGVSGYFTSRQNIWEEPIDRNVFGRLREFGDAEIASLIAPRHLAIEAAAGPEVNLPGEHGSAPGVLVSPSLEQVTHEWKRAQALVGDRLADARLTFTSEEDGQGSFGSEQWLTQFFSGLKSETSLATTTQLPEYVGKPVDQQARMVRQMNQINRQNQTILADSAAVRTAYFRPDNSSLAAYEKSIAPYRETFETEVIGKFERPLLPASPRTRQIYSESKWTGYEVALDVFPEVFAYGLLLLPSDMAPDEKRPVVVCQHGLEGRPDHLIGEEKFAAYQAYAVSLVERGFVVFCPQNPYIYQDRFRTLQRKANALGKTLFSIIVPQHRQITQWLKTQPYVDPDRIAFYGLSYGGKSAMRIPPLVPAYSAVICSGDFNAWIDKVASTRNPRSYIWTGEYEIFEFNLGNTFGYAEMAGLIAPRPFMVERGHFDGVADDEKVGHEFAKVRHLYAAQLKIPEQCEIEWFDGGHMIHGQGSFDFLHRHLQWPKR